MNRKERRAYKHEQNEFRKSLPDALTLVPPEEMPDYPKLLKAWRSKRYVVQLFDEIEMKPGLLRLSICRVQRNHDGNWKDGLTWDELQNIKRELGYGNVYAVEVYPRDRDIIAVANFRHLWLLAEPLPIGWFTGANQ